MNDPNTNEQKDYPLKSKAYDQRLSELEDQVQKLVTENQRTTETVSQQHKRKDSFLSRRQILGLLGGGTLLGATGATDAQRKNQNGAQFADKDHDHSNDYLGKEHPVDRLDVENIHTSEVYNSHESNSVIQTAWDGLVIPVAPGLGASTAINPEKTDTPVQDAIDKLPNNGGTVLLPPEKVVNKDTITVKSGVTIQGWGIGYAPSPGGEDDTLSKIRVPIENKDLMIFTDDRPGVRECGLLDFELLGPVNQVKDFKNRDPSDTTGVGIRFGPNGRNIARLYANNIKIYGVQNAAMKSTRGAKFTESVFGQITVEGVDAGNANAVFDFSDECGAGLHFDVIGAYPVSSATGSDSDVFKVGRSGDFSIRNLNVGGSPKRALVVDRQSGMGTVRQIHVEGRNQNERSNSVVNVSGDSRLVVESVTLVSEKTNHIYNIGGDNSGNIYLGRSDEDAISSQVLVEGNTDDTIIYEGPSNDVKINSGETLSTPISCLGDLTLIRE